MIEAPEKKRLLTDTGTRYQFYRDLLEEWENGLEVVIRSMEKYASDNDKKRKTMLEHAIHMMAAQITRLADYDKKQWDLRDEISRIPKDPFKTVGGRGSH